jgi:hypothetical protein
MTAAKSYLGSPLNLALQTQDGGIKIKIMIKIKK